MAEWGSGSAFAGREEGLKEKAAALTALCGKGVCVLGCGPDGEIFFWPDGLLEVLRVAETFLERVGGGGATAMGKKRKRAEEVEADGIGSPGADGGAVKARESVDDNFGGGQVAAATDPWKGQDIDFELLESLGKMCHPPVVTPEEEEEDLLELAQMVDAGGVLPVDPLSPSAAAESQLITELYFAALGGAGSGATVGKKQKKVEAGAEDLLRSGSLLEELVSHGDGYGGLDGEFDLTEALCLMCSRDLLEPLRRDDSAGPSLSSALVDLSTTISTGVTSEATLCDPESLGPLEGGAFPSNSASLDHL